MTGKKRVGILRGGAGSYYETSLREGGDVLAFIFENLSDRYKPIDILIDKEGAWHAGGVPIRPTDLLDKVDIVWNASHPNFSQALKESIPFVGANLFSTTLTESRTMLEKQMKAIGLKMPRHIILPFYQEDFDARPFRTETFGRGPKEAYAIRKAKEVFEKFSSPWVIKSLAPDAEMGIHVAKTFPELVEAIKDGVLHQKSILVEELIPGQNVSVHSVSGFRGEDIYTFPAGYFMPVEKVPTKVGIPIQVGEKLSAFAREIHKRIGAKHYLKSDFILSSNKGIYLTDINFSPDFKKDSHFCQSCEYLGAQMHHVLEHMLESALLASR